MTSEPSSLIYWIIIIGNVYLTTVNGQLKHGLVLSPIEFVEEPKNVVAKKGSSVLLNCSIRIIIPSNQKTSDSLVSETSVFWLKDGERLNTDSSKSSHFVKLSNDSLRINRLRQSNQRNDEGDYQCLVENSVYGMQSSKTARLRIAYMQNNFTRQPVDTVAYKGSVVRLWCEIEGWPPPTISWTKNGNLLSQENRYMQLPSGSLEIWDVTSGDKGSYRCIATNIAKNRTSVRAKLQVLKGQDVEEYLDVLSKPKNLTATVKETAILECAATGIPLPHITWTKGTNVLDIGYGRFQTIGKDNLQITDVQLTDSGSYACNIYQEKNRPTVHVATLFVQESPFILKTDVTFQEYATEINNLLTCQFSGLPSPVVSWTRNSQELIVNPRYKMDRTYINPTVSNYTLKISQSEEADSGIYQCTATNMVGQAIGAIRINVTQSENAPPTPINLFAFALSATEIELQWDMPPTYNMPLKAFTVHYIAVNGHIELQHVVNNTTKLKVLKSLQPFTTYKCYVKAWNLYGASHNSEYINATTEESYPVAAPDVELVALNLTSLYITWQHLPSSKARGIVTFYQIYLRKHQASTETFYDVPGNVTEYTWTGLEPSERYDIRVRPATASGLARLKDDYWQWFTAQTKDEKRTLIHLQAENSSTLTVKWENIELVSEMGFDDLKLKRLVLTYNQVGSNQDVTSLTELKADTQNVTVYNLVADTQYSVSLTLHFMDGNDKTITKKIWMPATDDPYQPPVTITTYPISPTQVSIKWMAVTWSGCDVHYRVRYSLKGDQENQQSEVMEIKHAVSPTIIKELEAYTEYEVSIIAFCTDIVRESRVVIAKTAEGLPSEPVTIKLNPKGSDKIIVTWTEPDKCNGIITNYKLLYTENHQLPDNRWFMKMENATKRKTEVDSLKSRQTYHFKMCAVTSVGSGKFTKTYTVETQTVVSGQTTEGNNGKMGLIVGCVIGGGSIIICVFVLLLMYNRPCNKIFCCCCRRRNSAENNRMSSNGLFHHGNGYSQNCNHHPHTSQDMECHQPMLFENHIDSKGGKSPPIARNHANGIVMHTQYMSNGNVRTVLADDPVQHETSFGMNDSQLPLTSTRINEESIDDPGLHNHISGQKEFDPDSIDTDSFNEENCQTDINSRSKLSELDINSSSAKNISSHEHGGNNVRPLLPKSIDNSRIELSEGGDNDSEISLPSPPPTPPELKKKCYPVTSKQAKYTGDDSSIKNILPYTSNRNTSQEKYVTPSLGCDYYLQEPIAGNNFSQEPTSKNNSQEPTSGSFSQEPLTSGHVIPRHPRETSSGGHVHSSSGINPINEINSYNKTPDIGLDDDIISQHAIEEDDLHLPSPPPTPPLQFPDSPPSHCQSASVCPAKSGKNNQSQRATVQEKPKIEVDNRAGKSHFLEGGDVAHSQCNPYFYDHQPTNRAILHQNEQESLKENLAVDENKSFESDSLQPLPSYKHEQQQENTQRPKHQNGYVASVLAV